MENMLKYTELKGEKNNNDDDDDDEDEAVVAAAAAAGLSKSDALQLHRHCCTFYLEFRCLLAVSELQLKS